MAVTMPNVIPSKVPEIPKTQVLKHMITITKYWHLPQIEQKLIEYYVPDEKQMRKKLTLSISLADYQAALCHELGWLFRWQWARRWLTRASESVIAKVKQESVKLV